VESDLALFAPAVALVLIYTIMDPHVRAERPGAATGFFYAGGNGGGSDGGGDSSGGDG